MDSSHDAYLTGWKLRLVSALLRAPLIGPPLRRVLAARVLAPVLAPVEEEELAPLFAPPPYKRAADPESGR